MINHKNFDIYTSKDNIKLINDIYIIHLEYAITNIKYYPNIFNDIFDFLIQDISRRKSTKKFFIDTGIISVSKHNFLNFSKTRYTPKSVLSLKIGDMVLVKHNPEDKPYFVDMLKLTQNDVEIVVSLKKRLKTAWKLLYNITTKFFDPEDIKSIYINKNHIFIDIKVARKPKTTLTILSND